jgi:CRISPR-associated protein Csx17
VSTLNIHHLRGCAPAPLAHYLKALGILRLLAEQKDPNVRGWWQDEHFCVLTTVDREQLKEFFLQEYAPTALINPWGARSGFFPGSSEKGAREALETILRSGLPRLAGFRAAVAKAREALAGVGGTKPDTDEEKNALLRSLGRGLRGPTEEWLACVQSLVGESYRAPALMGSGGNEGSGSYTSAFAQALVTCVVDRAADHALNLFGTQLGPVRAYRWGESFGQFDPTASGSAWDLVLALEGATVLRSGVTTRAQVEGRRFLASPFYFEPHAVGAGSSAPMDEFVMNKGRASAGRGEQWFPVWSTPASFAEIVTLLSEGRCSTGRTRAARPLDAVRAIGQLGITRGVSKFLRYGYLQRNNLATHFAVPLGAIDAGFRPTGRLVEDIASWQKWLHLAARKKTASARLIQAEGRLGDAVFAALTHDATPGRWQAVLLAAVAVEAIQSDGTGFEAGPIPPLAPAWVNATDDGSPEWRLARALGSAASGYHIGRPIDAVRQHWLPLEADGRRFRTSDKRLVRDPRVVISGRDAVADCGALVERRLVEAAQRGQRHLPLVAARGCGARPADLAALIAGTVDIDRVLTLARAFMAVRWHEWVVRTENSTNPEEQPAVDRHARPEEAWLAIRLASLPWRLDENRDIPVDAAMIRRLRSGDSAGALAIALRRLCAAGLRPPLRGAVSSSPLAHLWASALAFPITWAQAQRFARSFEPSNRQETR